MAVPKKDSELAAYSTNFNTRVVASPTTFSLTSTQASAYTALHDPFIAAYAAINSPGAKSKSLVSVKDAAKAALLPYARELYSLVQASLTVSDANKELLGITVRAAPSPVPAPTVSPALDIVSVTGNTVRVRVHDAAGEGKRSKPAGVKGVAICSFVGAVAPTDPSAYKWEGSTARSVFDVVFPDSLTPGTVVWLTAMWFNNKQVTGPACIPISTHIQYGMSAAA